MSAIYWTLFYYGGSESICSKHRSLPAAQKAVKACEKRGGAKHRIVKVVEIRGYKEDTL